MHPVDNFIYQVKGEQKYRFMNLIERTCTFRRFDLDLLPCAHVAAVIRWLWNMVNLDKYYLLIFNIYVFIFNVNRTIAFMFQVCEAIIDYYFVMIIIKWRR